MSQATDELLTELQYDLHTNKTKLSGLVWRKVQHKQYMEELDKEIDEVKEKIIMIKTQIEKYTPSSNKEL